VTGVLCGGAALFSGRGWPREHAQGVDDEVRLMPVTLVSSVGPGVVEIGVGEVVLRVRAGTDAGYVEQFVAALRGQS